MSILWIYCMWHGHRVRGYEGEGLLCALECLFLLEATGYRVHAKPD